MSRSSWLCRVDGQHRELLLVQRPERRAGDEHRDEREDPLALHRGDVRAAEDDGEVGQGRADRDDDDAGVEVARLEHAGRAQDADDGDRGRRCRARTRAARGAAAGRAPRWRPSASRFRPIVYWIRPMAIPTAAAANPTWKPKLVCSQSGEQRSEERAEVDAQVEQREAGVATRVVRGVEGADERRGVGLDPAAAERDEDQADARPRAMPGKRRQGDVPGHDEDRRVEQRALGPDEPVGHPGPGDGAEVDQPAVGADDADRGVLGDPQSAVLDRVVQVEQQDALHAVEAEPLPQLDAEEVGQDPRLAEEGPLVVLRLLVDVGHAHHDGTGEACDVSTERVILRVSRLGVRTAVRTAGARTTARRCRRRRRRPAAPRRPTRPSGAGGGRRARRGRRSTRRAPPR